MPVLGAAVKRRSAVNDFPIRVSDCCQQSLKLVRPDMPLVLQFRAEEVRFADNENAASGAIRSGFIASQSKTVDIDFRRTKAFLEDAVYWRVSLNQETTVRVLAMRLS